jgi:hypothetical protein
VSVGILTRQSTEWTGLYHGDQPSPKFEILVTNVDNGPIGMLAATRNENSRSDF